MVEDLNQGVLRVGVVREEVKGKEDATDKQLVGRESWISKLLFMFYNPICGFCD